MMPLLGFGLHIDVSSIPFCEGGFAPRAEVEAGGEPGVKRLVGDVVFAVLVVDGEQMPTYIFPGEATSDGTS
jgi:hypothetical protein